MAQTLVIHDVVKEYETVERGGIFGTEKIKHKSHLFWVIYPDGTEKEHTYADIRAKNSELADLFDLFLSIISRDFSKKEIFFRDLRDSEKLNREVVVQKIINDLENKGYSVNISQMSLFMSSKIDKLILSKID